MRVPEQETRLEAAEYLAAPPDAFGDIEVVDGLVVHNMAQSELHDLVVRRLAAAWRTPVRLRDRASGSARMSR